ncbi:MAG: OmpH family outer membrane protein [Gammaproteobacteria bacterium]|nr:OmpH family outer membrane protein [Gammaproteobacteria bacterium]
MVRTGIKACLILSALTVLSAQATNVAVIDLNTILKNYDQVNTQDVKLHQQFAARSKQVEDLKKTVAAEKGNVDKNALIMSKQQSKIAQAKLSADETNLAAMEAAFSSDFQAAQESAVQGILNQVDAAVIKIAKAQGYQVVIQKDNTVYVDDAVDISKQVLSALQANEANTPPAFTATTGMQTEAK